MTLSAAASHHAMADMIAGRKYSLPQLVLATSHRTQMALVALLAKLMCSIFVHQALEHYAQYLSNYTFPQFPTISTPKNTKCA